MKKKLPSISRSLSINFFPCCRLLTAEGTSLRWTVQKNCNECNYKFQTMQVQEQLTQITFSKSKDSKMFCKHSDIGHAQMLFFIKKNTLLMYSTLHGCKNQLLCMQKRHSFLPLQCKFCCCFWALESRVHLHMGFFSIVDAS